MKKNEKIQKTSKTLKKTSKTSKNLNRIQDFLFDIKVNEIEKRHGHKHEAIG